MPYTIIEDCDRKLLIVKTRNDGDYDSLVEVRAAAVNDCPRHWDVVFSLGVFDDATSHLYQGE